MPWWNNKSHIVRVGEVYTLYHDNGTVEEIDFTSAHNFKICTDYLEVDTSTKNIRINNECL